VQPPVPGASKPSEAFRGARNAIAEDPTATRWDHAPIDAELRH
jgi:hypothetical protein